MAIEEKYGKIFVEKGSIPEHEPVFLLRAQDVLAPIVVRYYAELRRALEGKFKGKNISTRIVSIADRMAAWPVKKLPD